MNDKHYLFKYGHIFDIHTHPAVAKHELETGGTCCTKCYQHLSSSLITTIDKNKQHGTVAVALTTVCE